MSAPENLKLISRRASALLLEEVPIQLLSSAVSGRFIADAITREKPWSEAEGNEIGARTSLIVGSVVALGWFLLRDTVPGLSWGKMLLGIRVMDADGKTPARMWQRALRNLIFVLPMLQFAEGAIALIPFMNGQRLGDLVARTRIVMRNERAEPRWTDADGAILLLATTLFVGSIIAGRYITEEVFWMYYD